MPDDLMTTHPQAPATVTQADREAMIRYENRRSIQLAPYFVQEIRDGKWDDHHTVQAFARHRQTSTAALEAENVRLREALQGFARWFQSVRDVPWDDIVADGGVTAWMVIQQEVRTVQLPRALPFLALAMETTNG